MLALAQDGERLDDPVTQRGKKIRTSRAQRLEHIAGKLPAMRALFDEHEIVRPLQLFPNLGELRREQFSKERANAHAREVIATSADPASARAVVAQLRMIKRLRHETRERDRSLAANQLAQEKNESHVVGGGHRLAT